MSTPSTVSTRSSIWHNQAYLILWSGQIVSALGNGIAGITVPLLVLSLTHSPAQAGVVAALFGLPYPIFGLLAGALVDRWDRKRVMIVCEIINIPIMTVIPVAIWTGHLAMYQIYIGAVALGTTFVFFNVAELAALPSVVAERHLATATAQNQATWSLAGILGPPIGGILYQVSRAVPFAADAVSYAVSLVSLLLIKVPFQGTRTTARGSLREEIVEGVVWLWRHHTIRAFTLLTFGFNLCTGGFGLVVIVLARQHHASPALIGIMFAIASAGGVVGAILAPRLQRRLRLGWIVIGALALNALLYPLYLVAPSAIVIGIINAAAFMIGPAYNTSIITYRLFAIPDALQGRVNSAVRVIVLGVSPLGAAVTGWLLQSWGTTGTIWLIAGMFSLLTVAALAVTSVRAAVLVSGAR